MCGTNVGNDYYGGLKYPVFEDISCLSQIGNYEGILQYGYRHMFMDMSDRGENCVFGATNYIHF